MEGFPGRATARLRIFIRFPAALAAASLIAAFAALSCGQGGVPIPFRATDLCPPQLLGLRATGPRDLVLEFSEDASFAEGSLVLYREGGETILPEAVTGTPGTSPGIALAQEVPLGRECRLEGTVEDAAGNTLSFYALFYGYNPRPPTVLINEIRTDSSAPECDLIEFFVRKGGYAGGLCVCAGSREDYDWRYLFPAVELSDGEYVVLHLKADPSGAGLDETGALDASGGEDASPLARDLWYKGEAGLPKSNGAVSLHENPSGELLDAILYSDRNSGSDERYGGFGTAKMKRWAEAIASGGGWKYAAGRIAPEDCASSAGTTETRSICRGPDSADSDSRADWHLVPTKGATFGAANSPEVYVPVSSVRGAAAKGKGAR